jgi:hypothetical protein
MLKGQRLPQEIVHSQRMLHEKCYKTDATATTTATVRRRKMGAGAFVPLEKGHDGDDGRKEWSLLLLERC